MTIRKVILALRGFNGINSFEDKRVFWNSFINLQKNLPSNIQLKFILQNHNGKESKLNSFLFEPLIEFNLKKDNISFDFKEYKKNKFFKRNIIQQINISLKESYYISSISSYLGNKKNKYKFDQLILLNYNLRAFKKSIFIYDNLLPLNKIYLRYSDYIDQGYPIDHIIIPKKFLEIFSIFNKFFLNSISNENNYLKKYNISGFPLSFRRRVIKEWVFFLNKYFRNLIINFLNLVENNIFRFNDIRIFRFIVKKIKILVNIPHLTRENSFVKDSMNQGTFYLNNILPIKPILKHFIYENHLRKDTRFIVDNDFENYNDSYIIGKKNFILVLKDDGLLNEEIIKSELYNLKFKPKFILFVQKNKIILYKYFQKINRFTKAVFFCNKKHEYQNILYVLFKIQNHNKLSYYPPILILNSLSTYKSCNDLSYLNTLLQFFIWEDIGYVSFKNINCKKNYSGFPELYYYPKKNKLILEECIINFKLLKESKYNNPVKLNNETYNDILILNNKNKLFL